MPIDRTRAKSVIRLMVSPNAFITENVPTSETGTANAGMSVERQSPRKMNTTNATRKNASISVCSTFSIDASRKVETSKATL